MNNKWSNEEIEILKTNYLNKTDLELSEILNRNANSIEKKRRALGLTKKKGPLNLSEELKREILNSGLSYKELEKKYNLSYENIRSIFRREKNSSYTNKRNVWTEEEIEYLKENYTFMNDREIGEKLNKTQVAVLKKRNKLGLERKERINPKKSENSWNEEEINFLKKNIDILSYKEIAKKIDRTEKAVTLKASRLNLLEMKGKWMFEEDKILVKNQEEPIKELSNILGRSKKSISHRRKKFYIKKIKEEDIKINFEINDKEIDSFFIGSMLGDGSTSRRTKNALFKEAHSQKQKAYLLWKKQIIENISTTKLFPIVHNKLRVAYIELKTKTNEYFTKLDEQFYDENRIKRVNLELLEKLTPLGLAVWYMDDGHGKKKNGLLESLIICTESFTIEENEQIITYFKNNWDIEWKKSKRGKDKVRIICYGENMRKFIKIIEPYIIKSMEYKIKSNRKKLINR